MLNNHGKKTMRNALKAGETMLGSWLQFAQPAHAEVLARAGFDWVAVDLEHSVIGLREAEDLIRIIDLSGVAALVRMSSNDPVQIARIMDGGAHGVIVPRVNGAAEAAAAVDAVFYPPQGSRGVGLARAQGYGDRFTEYHQWLADEAVVIVQIEHVDGVENMPEILAVEGVHGFLIGPYDLSASLGVPGQLEHPKMVEAMARIHMVAADFPAVAPGIHKVSIDPEPVIQAFQEGYRLVAYSADMHFMRESCQRGMRSIKNFLGRTDPVVD